MTKKNKPLHLLLLDSSQNDAELVVSLLRNAGYATRAHRITSMEDMDECLTKQPWDLFISREIAEDIRWQQGIEAVQRHERDLPFLLLIEDDSNPDLHLEALQAGARDAVPVSRTAHLVHVARREYASLEDRRRRLALEAHLKEAEKRCQILLESSRDAIAYVAEGMHIFANQSYLELFQYEDVDELMCVPLMDIVASKDQDDFRQLLKDFRSDPAERQLSCTVTRADESELEVTLNLTPATYDGEDCIQLMALPIVDSELEEKLRKFSSEDLLTGLFNKRHFTEELSNVRQAVVQGSQARAMAFYIELDRFAELRDTYTLAGSDTLLAQMATLLRQLLPADTLAARLGDDTFALLCQDMDEDAAVSLAEKIRKAVSEFLFTVGDRTVAMTVSIGIVRITEKAPEVTHLLERLHKACAHIQQIPGHEKGNGTYLYNALDFEAGDNTEDQYARLQQAMDDGRFRILFQPVISLRGESEEHYESFLRIINNEGEQVSPSEFLPISDRPELAIKVDRWVTLQNIRALAAHRSEGHATRNFINLTPHSVVDSSFLDWLAMALKAANLPANSLIFQLTEEDAVQYLKQLAGFSQALRKIGCELSLSHFGCALNPLNILKHLRLDYVRLDGSHLREMQSSEDAREALKEQLSALRAEKVRSIMPEVESAAVLSLLWQAGVDLIQGFYIQGPGSAMNYDFSDND